MAPLDGFNNGNAAGFLQWLEGDGTRDAGELAGQPAAGQLDATQNDGSAFLRWLGEEPASSSTASPTLGEDRKQEQTPGEGFGQGSASELGEALLPGNLATEEDGKIGPSYALELDGGGAVLVPTTDESGRLLTTNEMRARYDETGQNWGTFGDRASARAYQERNTSGRGREALRSQILLANGISLEQQKKDRETAQRLGLSPEVIAYNREYAENEAQAREFELYEQLVDFASTSPIHAAIAAGDLEAWKKLALEQQRIRQYYDGALGDSGEIIKYREASVGEIWEMGDISRQEAHLTYQYLFEGADVAAQMAALAQRRRGLAGKLTSDDPLSEFFRLGFETLPMQLQMYGKGALMAAGAGLATAGAGAAMGAPAGGVPGAIAGATASLPLAWQSARAGFVAGVGTEAYRLEAGSMGQTLLNEKDADGNPIPLEVVRAASMIYGLVSSGLEAASETLFLELAKPLGMSAHALKEGGKGLLRGAIVRAAKDKSVRAALMNLAGRLGANMVQEGITETLQEGAAIATEVATRSMMNATQGTSFETGLPEDWATRLWQSFQGGASGAFFIGGGPMIAASVHDMASAYSASQYSARQNEFHAVLEETALKQADPVLLAEVLPDLESSMNDQVLLPLDAAVELHQSGVDILSPLGISLETAQLEGAAGQAVSVKLADLHARLDQRQFEAASQIMHRTADSASAIEVNTATEDLVRRFEQSLNNVVEQEAEKSYVGYLTQEQRTAFDLEMATLREELQNAVAQSPNLQSQIQAMSRGSEYVDGVLKLLRRVALLQARRTGRSPVDLLRMTFMRGSARLRALEAASRGDVETQIGAELADNNLEAQSRELVEPLPPVDAQTVPTEETSAPVGQTVAEDDTATVAEERAASERIPETAEAVEASLPAEEIPADATEVVTPAQPMEERADEMPETASAETLAQPEVAVETMERPVRRLESTLADGDPMNVLETAGEAYPIRYEIWELDDVIPSHDPTNQFARREDYPGLAQERAYHSVGREQEKVRNNASNLNPRYLITDNPDASTGPPVITRDGIVLGGNSRTMSMQLAFLREDKRAQYKSYLAGRAAQYGLDAARIDGMSKPVLVRVLQAPMTLEEMSIASNSFNQTTTEELDPIAEGVSKSRRIDDAVLAVLSAGLEKHDTLREYMSSAESKELVELLRRVEIISPNAVSKLTTNEGLLSESGKLMLEGALRGLVVQDYDILHNASTNMASVLNKLDRAILPLVRMKMAGGNWDLAPTVTKALQQIFRADSSTRNFKLQEDLPGYFASGLLEQTLDPDKTKVSVQAIALMLVNSSQREVAARFAAYAEFAAKDLSRQGIQSLVPTTKPEQAFLTCFTKTLASVGNTPFSNFTPASNPRHAAIQWAYDNMSRHALNDNNLNKAMEIIVKAPEAERETLRGYMSTLASLNQGQIDIYEPKLGPLWGRNQSGTFWQAAQYEQTPMSDTARASLERDSRAFADAVGRIVANGKPPSIPVQMLTQTPLVLQLVGADTQAGKAAATGGIFASPHVFDGTHPNVTPDMLKQLPAAMADPIAIFDSATRPGDLVFMLEVTDANGATVVAPVVLHAKGVDERVEINIVKSAYTKEQGGRPNINWFKNQLKKNARYVNGQKLKQWQDSAGVQFPFTPLLTTPNKKIRTETDLVNARRQNLTLYQTAYHGTPNRFSNFSLEHVGEGEGAQAHGWGLYFASEKGVSEGYRRALRNGRSRGQLFRVEIPENSQFLDEQLPFAEQPENVRQALASFFRGLDNEQFDRLGREAVARANFRRDSTETAELRREKRVLELRSSNIRYINEHKERPEDSRSLFAKSSGQKFDLAWEQLGRFYSQEETSLIQQDDDFANDELAAINSRLEELDALLAQDEQSFEERRAQVERAVASKDIDFLLANASGEQLYAYAATALGSPREASLALNERGIRGITYEGETDGRCFVIFDESSVEVVRTYYQSATDNAVRAMNDAQELAEGNVRGAVTADGGSYIVDLFRNADMSTLLHEMGHVYFLEMERAVNQGYADAAMRKDFDVLRSWVGATPLQGLTVEQHEQLARGLEAYYLEGKAPSEDLQTLFTRLRKWLKRIYQSVANLNVELNDEVRGVFDRMFATEQEIEEVAATNNIVNLTTGELDALGVPKAQQEYTRMVLESAKEKAAERLMNRRNAERTQRRLEYARQAAKEINASPVYSALRDMRKTPMNRMMVSLLLGENMVEQLTSSGIPLAQNEGADPTVLAAEHGFNSVEEMARQVMDAPRKGQAIRRRVAELELQYDQQFSALDELVSSEELVEHASLVARHLAKVAQRPYIQQAAINQVVDRISATKSITELSSMPLYMANVRKALKAERKAVAQKDFDAAVEANTQARLNLEMVKRAKDIKERAKKLENRTKNFTRSKSQRDLVKFAVHALAAQHGLVKPNRALLDKFNVDDLHNWVKELEEDGFTLALDPETLQSNTNWHDMTIDQFEEFESSLLQIITTARNQNKLFTAKENVRIEEAAAQIEKRLSETGKARKEDTFNDGSPVMANLRKFHISHMKVEELCLMMDGGKTGGPLWEYIYKPINEAENKQTRRMKKERDFVKNELFGKFFSQKEIADMAKDRIMITLLGQALSREQRLAAALNMGNAVNMQRLKEGHNLTDQQVQAIAQTLTSREWEFVQAVWDYFESFRPEAFKLEEKLTGHRPTAVQGKPFKILTVDGVNMQLRGGYYPIKYNFRKNSVAFAREQKDMAETLMGGKNYMHAMTKHGHLKERTKGGLENAPLLLQLSVIPEHVYATVHDICYRPAVVDVSRIIRNKQVRAAIERFTNRETYLALKPWLVDCANEGAGTPSSDIQALASWARSGASIFAMGFKATTAFTQMVGITQSMAVLGTRDTMRGVVKVLTKGLSSYKNANAFLEVTREKSAFMAGRLESFDRDLRDTTKILQRSNVNNWVSTIQQWAFKPMAYMQFWSVDLPTWWGAYEKGLKDFHGNEQQAVDYADSVVRQSQGSGSTKDLSSIQRGSDLQRLFTMFYSYFNVLYNLGARNLRSLRKDHSSAGVARLATQALLLWFLPAALSEFVAGRWGGDDDDESTAAWLTKLWLAYPFQSVVGVRDVASAMESGFDYTLSPAASGPASIVKMVRSIGSALEKDDYSKMVKPTAQAIFYIFRMPGAQITTTTENVWDYLTDPQSEFYVRDLFFRKPADRRK